MFFSEHTNLKHKHKRAGCQTSCPMSIKLSFFSRLIGLKLSNTLKVMSKTRSSHHIIVSYVCECEQQGKKSHVYIRSVY